ncbi:S26 family signal peptidase [Candidatus Daviesbacteria bacterium]|nr:S26 family signal peptidase [Candidatus Daviesbacteria bacterium]
MLPVFKPGQEVLTFNWAHFFSRPKIGDIVVIKVKGKEIVKRIQKLCKDGYFVQGDNAPESTDSRDFGPIDKSKIVGKVIVVVR